jgi:hypothetical protein
VCIGTHASVERMHWLVQVANRWAAPISLTLFVPDVEFAVARLFIEFLRNCYPAVRDRVRLIHNLDGKTMKVFYLSLFEESPSGQTGMDCKWFQSKVLVRT